MTINKLIEKLCPLREVPVCETSDVRGSSFVQNDVPLGFSVD